MWPHDEKGAGQASLSSPSGYSTPFPLNTIPSRPLTSITTLFSSPPPSSFPLLQTVKNKENKAGHDLFSSEKPEAIEQMQEERKAKILTKVA